MKLAPAFTSSVLSATLALHIFGTSSAIALQQEDPITVASMEIPYAYEENGEGVYHTVLAKLTEGYEGQINVNFVPSARFNRLITNRAVDCDYIGTDKTDRWVNDGIKADELEFIGPIRTLYVSVYVPAGKPIPKDIADLNNFNLASDVNLLQTIHKLGIKEKFSLQSQTQMLNLLSIGRINALIGYDFDLDLLAPKLGVQDKIVKTSLKLDKLVDGIVCFKTERTAKLRKHMREKLDEITKSGWLDAEFDKFLNPTKNQ